MTLCDLLRQLIGSVTLTGDISAIMLALNPASFFWGGGGGGGIEKRGQRKSRSTHGIDDCVAIGHSEGEGAGGGYAPHERNIFVFRRICPPAWRICPRAKENFT